MVSLLDVDVVLPVIETIGYQNIFYIVEEIQSLALFIFLENFELVHISYHIHHVEWLLCPAFEVLLRVLPIRPAIHRLSSFSLILPLLKLQVRLQGQISLVRPMVYVEELDILDRSSSPVSLLGVGVELFILVVVVEHFLLSDLLKLSVLAVIHLINSLETV